MELLLNSLAKPSNSSSSRLYEAEVRPGQKHL